LIRIVRNKDEQVLADPTGKSNGRGAYLCKNPDCIEKARKQKGLARALDAKIPDELYDNLKRQYDV
ncbi:MAG: YlxR family protein, partial [Eubacteriales bacterium]|nr:YlxR family protein [Eubacteriales bacterium]